MKVAQDSGAHAKAGHAALTLIEEHGPSRRLSESELVEVYRQADELLKGTQDADDIARLLAGARVVIKRLTGLGLRDRNFSFYSAVLEYEARLIEQALAEAEGGCDAGREDAGAESPEPRVHAGEEAQGAGGEKDARQEAAAEPH